MDGPKPNARSLPTGLIPGGTREPKHHHGAHPSVRDAKREAARTWLHP